MSGRISPDSLALVRILEMSAREKSVDRTRELFEPLTVTISLSNELKRLSNTVRDTANFSQNSDRPYEGEVKR